MSDPKRTAVPTWRATSPEPLSRTLRILLAVTGYVTALVSLLAVGAIGLILYADAQIQRVEVSALAREFNGPINVLLLGSDTREVLSEEEQETKGGPEDVAGVRSDTIILINLDPNRERATLVHFPRDLLVTIPGHGQDKINAALDIGGPDLVVRTIQRFTGIPIHHYLEVNFVGFRSLVDALGGVEVCVDRPLFDELAELDIPEAGCYTFDGDTALAFVRARNVEGDLIPDFSRIARQQQFIRALLNELISPSSIVQLPSLVQLAARNVTTDTRLTATDLLFLGSQLRDLAGEIGSGKSVDLRVVPAIPQTIEGISYVIAVQPETQRLFEAIRDGRPLGDLGTVQVGTPLSPALIRVQVLDAGVGQEGTIQVVDLLRRAGFIVLGTSGAPAGEEGSAILYGRGGRALAETVAGFFPGLPIREGSAGVLRGADIAIVVGPDYTGLSG